MSLVRFLLDRLHEDLELIIGDTPMFGVEVNAPRFEQQFLSRAGLIQKTRTELAEVSLIIQAMQSEQGIPPAAAIDFEAGPVTILGDRLLKLLAARYSDHPEYEQRWVPAVELPGL